MAFYAMQQGEAQPWLMGVVVFFAMAVSCTVAGIAGALIPLTLKRLGADPATASSIFLTTASDVASMGVFLGLATILSNLGGRRLHPLPAFHQRLDAGAEQLDALDEMVEGQEHAAGIGHLGHLVEHATRSWRSCRPGCRC